MNENFKRWTPIEKSNHNHEGVIEVHYLRRKVFPSVLSWVRRTTPKWTRFKCNL